MCRLIVVRHGESDANRERRFAASGEVPLTDLGRRQALDAAREIASRFSPGGVLTSSFRRAGETGEILATELGLPLAVLPDIQERDLGCLKGEPYEALRALAREDPAFDPERRWLWRPPGGESLEDVRVRAVAALAGLGVRHAAGAELVVVSHGAVMLSLWAHAAGSWEGAPLLDNCGLLLLSAEGGEVVGAMEWKSPAGRSTI